VPPFWDVYIWVPQPTPALFRSFLDHYVNIDRAGDERLSAFVRVHVDGVPDEGDVAALRDLGRRQRTRLLGVARSTLCRARPRAAHHDRRGTLAVAQ